MPAGESTPQPQTEGRGRLLFLSHRLPYPVHNGQTARTYNLLRELGREFEIVALCFDNDDESRPRMSLEERCAALAPHVRDLSVYRVPQDRSRMRFVFDHFASVITRSPYTYTMYDDGDFRRRLKQLLAADQFQLAHFESMDLLRYVPLVAPLPVACTHHNVESELLRRRADADRNPLRGGYIRHQARLLRTWENRVIPEIELNVAVSDNDRAQLEAIAPGAKVVTIPNGVDTEYFDPASFPRERRGCAFVGGTNWDPNRDALLWYTEEVLPEVAALAPDASTRWIGFARADEIREFGARAGLQMVGFVDDLREELSAAACFVVPLRVGGGTRLKVLEAWSMGCAVVSTSVGCEGLDARHEENILIADTPRDFAMHVSRVLEDERLRSRLGACARETAVAKYSWRILGARLRAHYRSIAPLRPAALPRQDTGPGSAG